MSGSRDKVIIGLLCLIVVLMMLNLLAVRFETKIVQAGGGGQEGEGWIAWSGQQDTGPEIVYVLNTNKGDKRTSGNKTWDDNGPRLAVYRVAGNGRIKLTSMRNIGPDLDEYLDSFQIDDNGPSVRDMKDLQKKGRSKQSTSGDGDSGEGEFPVD